MTEHNGENRLDRLPEELKSHIVFFLALEPPSSTWHDQEPRVSLADTDSKPLKNLSLVSREWRRLTVYSLFRCLRIKLDWMRDDNDDDNDNDYRIPSPSTRSIISNSSDATVRDTINEFKKRLTIGTTSQRIIDWLSHYSQQGPVSERVVRWLHALDRAFAVISSLLQTQNDNRSDGKTNNHLDENVETLSIVADFELDHGEPNYLRDEVHCHIASAWFWNHVFRRIDPVQVTLLAPPGTLACMLNCSMDMTDSWNFPGMSHQILTLRQTHSQTSRRNKTNQQSENQENNNSGSKGIDAFAGYDHTSALFRLDHEECAGPTPSSLLYIRPWTTVLVNEGSYIDVYATYEYYNKAPPGILTSVVRGFACSPTPMVLTNLTYHAVFPFQSYLEYIIILAEDTKTLVIESFNFRLAPLAGDKNWDDPARLGKADINDCWSEIQEAYKSIAQSSLLPRLIMIYDDGDDEGHEFDGDDFTAGTTDFATSAIIATANSTTVVTIRGMQFGIRDSGLKRFSCSDYWIDGIGERFQILSTKLGWNEVARGVWVHPTVNVDVDVAV